MAIRIYIDQGHNPAGFNTGAEGNGFFEQDVTYDQMRTDLKVILAAFESAETGKVVEL